MAWVAAAAAVVQAVGAIQQAQGQRAAAEYNAATMRRNAVVAQDQAAANEAAQRREAARAFGRMRAGYGAAGVTMEGSPLDALEASVAAAELDAQNIRYHGELTALGLRESAAAMKAQGEQATRAGYIRAASALGMGAANYYGSGALTQAPAPIYDARQGGTPVRVG